MDAAHAEGQGVYVEANRTNRQAVLARSVATDCRPTIDFNNAAGGLLEDSVLSQLHRSTAASVARGTICLLPLRPCLRRATAIQARNQGKRIGSRVRHVRRLRICEITLRDTLLRPGRAYRGPYI